MRKRNSDLLLRFNSINLQYQELYAEYKLFFDKAEKGFLTYQVKIIDSFIKHSFKRYGDILSEKTLEILSKDIPKLKRIKKYSIYNTLATLRIMTRKMNDLKNQNWTFKKRFLSLLADVKKLEEDISNRNMSEEETYFILDFLDLKESLLFLKKVEFDEFEKIYDFILGLFYENNTLSKQEFLQVITIAKDKERWDGTPATPYAEVIKEIPEIIDFETFRDLIFKKKIEDDRDCYLFDIFMDDALEALEQYTKETGRSPALEFLSEISGKPIQTYTAEIDEYGDIVSLEPNKPNLRAIEGGKVND